MSLRLRKQTPPFSHLYNCEVPDAPAVQSATSRGGAAYAGQLRPPRTKRRRAQAPASNPQPKELENPNSTVLANSGHERRQTWPRRCPPDGSRPVEIGIRGQEASTSHPGCVDAERSSGEQPGDTRPRDQ